ncbi:MAG TPA: type II toxin-antitoxin system HicB family antitoxin [Verrucomicrobiae bacterium]|jgi:predicted RNase H-like HicB family nuclease|nr:type II toxin-antitoxin system HicB family antitoxin [Verrucomicrobiae bacterium]
MASDNKYSIDMVWSVEDERYLAQVRELPGCIADGPTAQEAFQNLLVVLSEWLETAKEENREIPPPLTLEAMAQADQLARQQLQRQMEKSVRDTVADVLQKAETKKSPQNTPAWREGGFSRFTLSGKHKA